MRLASIDIGSNTIRLLVAEVRDGKVLPLLHERKVTRLARGLRKGGSIALEPLEATARAVSEFTSLARKEGASAIISAATSAIRDAINGSRAADMIEASSGISVRIITGHEEAEIMSMGVIQGFDGDINSAVIFDIGGGSTEFISLEGGEVKRAETYSIGVVGLMEKCIKSDPPTADDMASLDREILPVARKMAEEFQSPQSHVQILIGTAGTATTLASIDLQLLQYDWTRVQGHDLGIERLREMEAQLASKTLENRKKIKGMDPDRADLIIAGTRLTIRTMEALGFSTLTVSDHGLLEGLIVKLSMEAGQ